MTGQTEYLEYQAFIEDEAQRLHDQVQRDGVKVLVDLLHSHVWTFSDWQDTKTGERDRNFAGVGRMSNR